jgi:hypothetical protein
VDITDKIWVACITLLTSAIGSSIALLLKGRIDKSKFIYKRKSKLIAEWRTNIEKFDFENENFGNTSVYGAMKPYMDESVIKKFEAQRTFFVPPDGGRGDNLKKQWASDQVSKIERDWELL